jgi:hypothetical protein
MQNEIYSQSALTAQWIMAIGTILVAILAIFGEQIRDRCIAPRLRIALNDPPYELVTESPSNIQGIFYHLKIDNIGIKIARNVRIFCIKISKKKANGTYENMDMTAQEQLAWRFSNIYGMIRHIPPHQKNIDLATLCDLGSVYNGSKEFNLTVYAKTKSYPGFLEKNESMRLRIIATADNYIAKKSYDLEITWDGEWSSDLREMQKHLIIKSI